MGMTSKEQIKELLGGTFAVGDDALLDKLALAANDYVIAYLGYDPLLTTYTETKDGNGNTRISLDVPNVRSVVSVLVGQSYIPAVDPSRVSGYSWSKSDGIVSARGWDFPEGYDNVTIVYTAGFDAYPASLAMAATEIAALRWRVKSNIGIQSKTLANETITFTDKDMQASTRSTLDDFVKRYLPA